MGLAAGMGFLGLVTTSSSSSSSSSFMLSAKSGGSFDSVSPTHLSLLLKTLSRSPSSLEQYSKHLIFEVGRTSSSSLLESSAAFLADPSGLISCFAKITTTISTEHNTPSSYAFFNRPFFLLVKVTARFLSCVIGWISIFRRPIGVVDVFVWGDWRGGRRRGRYEVKVGSNWRMGTLVLPVVRWIAHKPSAALYRLPLAYIACAFSSFFSALCYFT